MKETEGAARVQDGRKSNGMDKNKQTVPTQHLSATFNKQNCHHKYSIVYSHLITMAFTIILLAISKRCIKTPVYVMMGLTGCAFILEGKAVSC